jgi:hypothetical protein
MPHEKVFKENDFVVGCGHSSYCRRDLLVEKGANPYFFKTMDEHDKLLEPL